MTPPIPALLLALTLLLHPYSLRAQVEGPPATQETVEEFIAAAHLGELFDSSIEAMLKAQIKQSPELGNYEDVMREFFRKYMSFESMKPDLIKLYQNSFSDADLKAALVFYRTPAGQRILARTPQLMADGGALGQQRVQAHLPELMEMIKAKQGSGSASPTDQN